MHNAPKEEEDPIRVACEMTVETEEGNGPNEDEDEGHEIPYPARRRLSGRCRQREKKRRQAREEQALKEPMDLRLQHEDDVTVQMEESSGPTPAKLPIKVQSQIATQKHCQVSEDDQESLMRSMLSLLQSTNVGAEAAATPRGLQLQLVAHPPGFGNPDVLEEAEENGEDDGSHEDKGPIKVVSKITVQTDQGDGSNEDQLLLKIERELKKDSQDKGHEIPHTGRQRLSGRCRQREKKRRQAREEEAMKEPMYLGSRDEELTGYLPMVTKEASVESSCEHLSNKGYFLSC